MLHLAYAMVPGVQCVVTHPNWLLGELCSVLRSHNKLWLGARCMQISEASRNHKRYIHYFERSKQHQDSLKEEKKHM